jgi:hypothetical protein
MRTDELKTFIAATEIPGISHCVTVRRAGGTIEKIRQAQWVTLLVIALTALAASRLEGRVANDDYCLTREGRISVIGAELTALYESKLFVTKDDLARYVFLTNANYDGDSSVALYRAPGKAGSLSGGYWVTLTEVPTSLMAGLSAAREKRPWVDPRSLKVTRADAPIPASAAEVVHKLWVAILERSQVDEKAIPCAPTAVFSAVTAGGSRLKGVTVSLVDDTPCIALVRLGRLLINYPQLRASKRLESARKIKEESQRLLKSIAR